MNMPEYNIKLEHKDMFEFNLLDPEVRDYLVVIAEDVLYQTDDATQERRVAYALLKALNIIEQLEARIKELEEVDTALPIANDLTPEQIQLRKQYWAKIFAAWKDSNYKFGGYAGSAELE